jgi:hypothetical protein
MPRVLPKSLTPISYHLIFAYWFNTGSAPASALLEGADATRGRKQRVSVMKTVDSLVSDLSILGQKK